MIELRPQEKMPSAEKPRSQCYFYLLSLLACTGGFLFGYDTGVISGAIILIKNEFTITDAMQELIVSVTVGAAAIFALFGAFLNDRFGRKKVILTSSLIFTVGAVEMALANKVLIGQFVDQLLVGRCIVGIGLGLSSMTVPMYLAEVAPSEHRGMLITLSNLFLTFGQFFASVVGGAFSYLEKDGWRYMLGLAAIPAAIGFVGFCFMPESPRWLIEHKRYDEAREALSKIGLSDRAADSEFDAIQASCIRDEHERKQVGSQWVIATMLSTPHLLRAITVGCALQMFQQITGINTVMYYSATIIQMAGIKNKHTVIWLSAATASVNFLATFIGLYLVDKIGRRLLTLGSLIGVAFSLLMLAVTFQVISSNSPAIEGYNSNSPCTSISSCQTCITYRSAGSHCGYCFFDDRKTTNGNGACLPYSSDDNHYSLIGQCNHTLSQSDPLTWTTDWCPTDISWLIVVGLVLYLVFFASGMGPMPWTINAEIYPQWARSTGNGLSTAVNWLFNLAISSSFLSLMTLITRQGAYYFYSALAFIAILFFWWVLPETRGLSLEEVQHLFTRRWCGPRPSRSTDDTEEKRVPPQSVLRVDY